MIYWNKLVIIILGKYRIKIKWELTILDKIKSSKESNKVHRQLKQHLNIITEEHLKYQ